MGRSLLEGTVMMTGPPGVFATLAASRTGATILDGVGAVAHTGTLSAIFTAMFAGQAGGATVIGLPGDSTCTGECTRLGDATCRAESAGEDLLPSRSSGVSGRLACRKLRGDAVLSCCADAGVQAADADAGVSMERVGVAGSGGWVVAINVSAVAVKECRGKRVVTCSGSSGIGSTAAVGGVAAVAGFRGAMDHKHGVEAWRAIGQGQVLGTTSGRGCGVPPVFKTVFSEFPSARRTTSEGGAWGCTSNS